MRWAHPWLAVVVKFFRANSDDGFVPIQPHEYPFAGAKVTEKDLQGNLHP